VRRIDAFYHLIRLWVNPRGLSGGRSAPCQHRPPFRRREGSPQFPEVGPRLFLTFDKDELDRGLEIMDKALDIASDVTAKRRR
jgi:hypothetical protein